MSEWPPEGYVVHDYTVNTIGMYAIVVVVSIALGVPTWPVIESGISLIGNDLTSAVLYFCLLVVVLLLMRAIHERIHYYFGQLLDLNPKYGHDVLGFKTNVTPMTTGIELPENRVVTGSPFVLIGLISGVFFFFSGGIVQAFAAFVLFSNSAASGQDLYHIVQFRLLPAGTLFANFEEDDEVRTEYAVPADRT